MFLCCFTCTTQAAETRGIAHLSSVQLSPLTDWIFGGGGGEGQEGRFCRDPLPVFSAGGLCEQFRHGQGCPLFDVVHPVFPLPTTASQTLQDALQDGFGEAVVACDMPEPCKFPSPDSYQKRFPWTHKEVDLAPHPIVGLSKLRPRQNEWLCSKDTAR